MLQYNFKRIFALRSIDKPFAFLKQYEFSDSFASKVKNDKVNRLNNRELEKLCLILNCTPNDLLEWIPEEGAVINEKHPMNKLLGSSKIININKAIRTLPLEKMEEVYKVINEKLEEFEE